MKRNAFYITAVSTALFITSCDREMTEIPQPLKTITGVEASISEVPQSRTHLEGTDKMKWDEWDEIGIFSDTDDPVPFYNRGGNYFRSPNGESVSGHEFYAYFPYSTIQLQSNRKELFLYNYNAGTGKNPRLDIPMVARYDGSAFAFKHTAGILHFSITGSQTLTSIKLKTNAGERVFGPSRINLEEETPILRCDDNGSDFNSLWLDHIALSKEEPFDVWFVLPPVTLSKGFTLVLEYDGGRAEKSTEKSVTLSRATIKNYTLVDLDQMIEEYDALLDTERDALIALYTAMDGPHWIDNTNWCSDKPLNEWFGVWTDWESGRVIGLSFEDNGLQGALPADLSNLKLLENLTLLESNGRITNIEQLGELSSLETLFFGIGENWVREYDHVKTLMFAVPANISNLKKLKRLTLFGINAELPEELFEMENLESLYLRYFNTGRPIQRGFGKLKNLKTLSITSVCEDRIPGSNPLCGEFPDDIYDLKNLEDLEMIDTHVGGQLSPRIGELTKLKCLNLGHNQFSGPLPAELATLHLIDNTRDAFPDLFMSLRITLSENHFSGKVPEAFRNWPEWQKYWGYIVSGNDDLDFKEVMPMIVPFEATSLTGETISSEQVAEHELTILFQTESWCPYSPPVIAEMKEIYPLYKDKGLEVFCYSSEDRNTVQAFAESYGFTWPTVSNSYLENWPMGFDLYPLNLIPCLSIFDKTGQLVYYQFGATGDWVSFVENYLGAVNNLYESTDYSADGTVHTLQTATSGNGIDIVLMGDGYSDRLIADGTYASVMQRTAEAFFSEEPYKSFRDCFNVYYVDVVSKNERYTAETALGSWYGTGTAVGGNDAKVIEYAKKVIPDSRMDDATVIVLMNRDYYAGTCYMYPFTDGDYGRGLSISYFPVSSFEQTFSGLVSHEAGGHGFGKLADEYYYASNGTIPQDKIDEYIVTAAYGWWRNGDFTSDPAAVKWSAFLTDDRYSAEGLGVYEGAFTYYYGAWRPTRNSIMNNNTGGFNAPSRYAIWYKIGKLANGAGWNGTYEDFVAWDAINRTPAAHARRKAQRQNYVEKDLPPLTPPVVIQHSWRDLQH